MDMSTTNTFTVYPLIPRLEAGSAMVPLRFEAGPSQELPERIELYLYHLHTSVMHQTLEIPRGSPTFDYRLPLDSINPIASGTGLSIRAAAGDAVCETALDAGDGPVRYGFVSDFSFSDRVRTPEVVKNLLKNHITHVQFYDWNYRPHQYAPEQMDEDEYTDTMGKVISTATLKHLMQLLREAGIRVLGYGAVYAAAKSYLDDNPRQGLYDITGAAFNLIDTFYIMNLDNRQWREQLLAQYRYAVETCGFDGIHMDTYGFPKSGWGYESDSDPELKHYDLKEQFVSIIHEWAEHGDVNIFNNVGGWPAETTVLAPQDACYIEVWPPHTRYHHLRTLIRNVSGNHTPVILAAYLEPFKRRDESGISNEKPIEAAQLLTAVSSSLGATTLLLGQENAVLTQPYYSDYSRLSEEEREAVRRFYDHQVRCRELLFDPELEDITESHGMGENREFTFIPEDPRIPVTHDGEPGSIMAVITRSPERIVVNLINLIDQTDDLWNEDKKQCRTKPGITIQVPKYSRRMRAFSCSADTRPSEVLSLPVNDVQGVRGPSVECTIESISQWTTLWFELD